MANPVRAWSPPQIVWSALAGMLVLTALGFSWFGYGFDWKTQASVKRMASEAVVANLADICVAQAHGAANSAEVLKEFAALSKWKQHSYIEEARWATMPGSDAPLSGVAAACAVRLRQT